ncbi:cobalamin biosynthesis protein CobG [Streptomyces sp. NPDC089799]|uniref:cobalamin biosynthesis protein CobG n=1 Tax=Streptomyces sp. NPDC089799 TaxID=3155066 RepID=UPI003439AAC8
MPPHPSAAPRDEPVIRDRGDACPGALRLHAADDGHLARVRIPGGLLTGAAAGALADAADRLGDGRLDLTSRGNIQLRGLGASCGGDLGQLLADAGLLPAPTHERIRNVVMSPLTGTGPGGRADVEGWVRELDRLLCSADWAAALSGRFLFACDDGRGDVAALDPDVLLQAVPDAQPVAPDADSGTGTGAGTRQGFAHGSGAGGAVGGLALVRAGDAAEAVEVAHADAPRAALVVARAFLDAARLAGTRAWQIRELPPEHALDADRLASLMRAEGIPGARAVPAPAGTAAEPPVPGPVGGALAVGVPLGRLTAAQLRALAEASGGEGGRLRATPWRGFVLPGPVARTVPAAATALAAAGLVTDPGHPSEGVTACAGRPGCAKSLADVRADALSALARPAGPGPGAERRAAPLPVHFSGCARRCGHPRGTAWVDVLATGHGYELSVHGRPVPSGPDLAASLTHARNTPAER